MNKNANYVYFSGQIISMQTEGTDGTVTNVEQNFIKLLGNGNMARKISRKGLVRKLDAICKQIVIARDNSCVICGTTKNLTPGHLFSRIAYSTRWDLDNLFCQCINCNFRHESDPYPLMNYAKLILGEDGVEELHFRYVTPRKFKDFQLQELYEELKKTLDEITK